jgi:hypothetical protein
VRDNKQLHTSYGRRFYTLNKNVKANFICFTVANSCDISKPFWKTVNTERHYGDENIVKNISLLYSEKW